MIQIDILHVWRIHIQEQQSILSFFNNPLQHLITVVAIQFIRIDADRLTTFLQRYFFPFPSYR